MITDCHSFKIRLGKFIDPPYARLKGFSHQFFRHRPSLECKIIVTLQFTLGSVGGKTSIPHNGDKYPRPGGAWNSWSWERKDRLFFSGLQVVVGEDSAPHLYTWVSIRVDDEIRKTVIVVISECLRTRHFYSIFVHDPFYERWQVYLYSSFILNNAPRIHLHMPYLHIYICLDRHHNAHQKQQWVHFDTHRYTTFYPSGIFFDRMMIWSYDCCTNRNNT